MRWRNLFLLMAIIGGSIAVAGLLVSAPTGVADRLLNSDRGMDMAPAVLALGVALIVWSTALWGLVECGAPAGGAPGTYPRISRRLVG